MTVSGCFISHVFSLPSPHFSNNPFIQLSSMIPFECALLPARTWPVYFAGNSSSFWCLPQPCWRPLQVPSRRTKPSRLSPATFLREWSGLYRPIKYLLHKSLSFFLYILLFNSLKLLNNACKQYFNIAKKMPWWHCLTQAVMSHVKEKYIPLKTSFVNSVLCDILISILDKKVAAEILSNILGKNMS